MAIDFRETLTDMSLGIVDNVPPDQIPDNAVADALNMVFDKRQQLRTRPGCSVFNYHGNMIGADINDLSGYAAAGGLGDPPTVSDNQSTDPIGGSNALSVTFLDASNTQAVEWTRAYTGDYLFDADNEVYTYSVYFSIGLPIYTAENGRSMKYLFQLVYSDGVDHDGISCFVGNSDKDGAGYVVPVYAGSLLNANVTPLTSDPGVSGLGPWHRLDLTFNCGDVSGANITIQTVWSVDSDDVEFVNDPAWVAPDPVPIVSYAEPLFLWGEQIYAGSAVDVAPATLVENDFAYTNKVSSRITSLFQHRNSDGTSAVYATSGTQLFEYDSTNKYFTDITGALNLPDDTLWQWITFNGEAIGVNRSDTAAAKANPVVIATPGGTPAALAGTPPKARYIASFNDRVWVVDEDAPWKVQCSKLGDHTDWTNSSRVIGSKAFEIGGGEENYDITGLHVHQGVLLVFKRRSIYAIVPGAPNTDISQYTVQQLTDEIGCLSGYTIKTLINDVVFLSSDGLTTLSLISRGGNYEASFLSQNLNDFRDFDRGAAENAVATVCPVKSQYIISFRSTNATYNDRTYVLDYSRFQDGNIGFTRCDGAWLAQSFANIVDDSGGDCVLMGSAPSNGVALVWVKDGNGNTFTDGGRDYEQVVVTKAYAPQDLFVRKRFVNWGLYLQLLKSPFRLAVQAKTDLTDSATRTYTINETGQVVAGAKWDEAIWDTDTWADSTFVDVVFTNRKFTPVNDFSAEGNLMQFTLTPRAGDGYVFRGLLLTGKFLNDKQRGQG